MKSSLQRRIKNAREKSKGNTPMRFLFTIKPIMVTNIPRDVEFVVFLWQRGAKLQETQVQTVDRSKGIAPFPEDTILKQSTTCYRSNDQWEEKLYKVKIQSVTQLPNGQDKTKTIGKYEIDFSVFCPLGVTGGEEEIEVNLKPKGVLRAIISSQWLKDIDNVKDLISDIPYTSVGEVSQGWIDVVKDLDQEPSPRKHRLSQVQNVQQNGQQMPQEIENPFEVPKSFVVVSEEQVMQKQQQQHHDIDEKQQERSRKVQFQPQQENPLESVVTIPSPDNRDKKSVPPPPPAPPQAQKRKSFRIRRKPSASRQLDQAQQKEEIETPSLVSQQSDQISRLPSPPTPPSPSPPPPPHPLNKSISILTESYSRNLPQPQSSSNFPQSDFTLTVLNTKDKDSSDSSSDKVVQPTFSTDTIPSRPQTAPSPATPSTHNNVLATSTGLVSSPTSTPTPTATPTPSSNAKPLLQKDVGQKSSKLLFFKKQKDQLQIGKTTKQDLEYIAAQTSLESLRQKAMDLLQQRDTEDIKAHQARFQLESLQRSLSAVKSLNDASLSQRMKHLEHQLKESSEMDVTQLLVQTKMQLADAHFEILQLKGQIQKEHVRNRAILNKFTSMQTQRDIMLTGHTSK